MSKVTSWNEPAISNSGLKALVTGCEIATKPAIAEGLRQHFDLDYLQLPARYPFPRYLEMLDWLRRLLYPLDKPELGYEKIGRSITKGFFQRPVGQVLKLTLGPLGTQRSVHYFFRIGGGALPFGEFQIVAERPGYIRAILYRVPGSPDLMRGMALESMGMAGIKHGSIKYTKLTEQDTQFEAEWTS